jgi:type IV secretory pathway VirB2 component (pilin)
MKFINLLSVLIFIISQNILMASSAYATNYTVTLDSKTTDCTDICSSTIGTGVITDGSNIFTFSTTNRAGITPGMEGARQYTFTGVVGSLSNQDAIKGCTDQCQAYKSDVGFNLGDLDAVSNLSSNTLSKAICNAFRIVTGGAGKTFASFAVIATGIGFFTGKVSWGLMIGVAAGIATMFGASSIVAAISGENANTMCNINFKN